MSKLAQLKALQEQARQTATDMTQAVQGQKARLLPEGYSLAHIVGLIEYGNQPQSFEGKPRPPAKELTLVFALYDEGYCNEDGTPYLVELFPFAESQNEKSRAFKLFKLLNWDGTNTTWIDLIGKATMVKIEHFKGGKDKKETKSRIDLAGFLPPIEPRSRKPYDMPELREEDLVCFLWDYPTIENWKELREWHQHRALDALNFAGSELEGMLLEAGLPTSYDKSKKTETEAPAKEEAEAKPTMAVPDDVPFEGDQPSTIAMPEPV